MYVTPAGPTHENRYDPLTCGVIVCHLRHVSVRTCRIHLAVARPIKQSCVDAGHTRRGAPGADSRCRECAAAARRADQRAKKAWVSEYKLAARCAHCGFADHPEALHLHHLDPAEKDMKVSQLCKRGWSRLRAEVAKCIVICANCHIVLHANERESVRNV